MTRRYFALAVVLFAVLINLIFPACGSNNGSSNYNPYAYNCVNGTCNGISGTPMFPTAITTSIDSYGSMAQLMIYSTGGGSVSIQAQVYISPSQGLCAPGTFLVQGSGSWSPNYGGTLGLVQGQLSGNNGFFVALQGEVYGGQDPFQSQPTQFYYQGRFGNACDQNAEGL